MKAARILIVEDEYAIARALSATVEHAGAACEIAATAAQARRHLQSSEPAFDAMILDIGLPDQNGLEFLNSLGEPLKLPTIVITAHGEIQNTIAARKLGVVEFFPKPIDFEAFKACLARIVDGSRTAQKQAFTERSDAAAFIGAARSMRPVFQQIAHACASEEPVLVRGEIGSGKSHAARIIQSFGLRPPENQASLAAGPGTSLEELDAALTRARGGVLVIEDVGELNPTAQVELVRQIERQDGTPFPRLIATSNQDLHERVREGCFRSELFYRLQILEVNLPPLRHRLDDLPALVFFFLGQLRPRCRLSISDGAMDRLCRYAWPGNLRELYNTMAYAVTMIGDANRIESSHLPVYLQNEPSGATDSPLPGPLLRELDHWVDACLQNKQTSPRYADLQGALEAALIEALIKPFDGKLAPMASKLQANRSTLRKKLRRTKG